MGKSIIHTLLQALKQHWMCNTVEKVVFSSLLLAVEVNAFRKKLLSKITGAGIRPANSQDVILYIKRVGSVRCRTFILLGENSKVWAGPDYSR